MELIKEPKGIDFSTKSEPWSEKELLDFRKIMQDQGKKFQDKVFGGFAS